MNVSHHQLPGSLRRLMPGASALGQANGRSIIDVTLKLRRKQPLPDLHTRPDVALSRDEFAARYGASQADIDKVTQVMSGYGLKTVDSSAGARTVRLSGTINAMESVFNVKLFNYAHADGNYRGRVGYLSIPVELSDIVQGAFGLDNRRTVRRRRQPASGIGAGAGRRQALSAAPASWYLPAQFGAHYHFPNGQGAGQTVGLVEFGGGFFPDDLKKFCEKAKVPVPKVTTVSTDGTSTQSKDGAEGEVMLDIEVVAGLCPQAGIVVYFASWTEAGMIGALDAAMQDKDNNPGVLSISWGAPERADIWSDQAMAQIDETLKEAAYLGITVCIAAGDDGSSDALNDGHAHADFPSSSQYALSVGGTTIVDLNGTGADIVWMEGDGLRSDQGGSTGGAVSDVFDRPDWQSGIAITSVNPGAINGRCIPDVSANADWNASPYLLVVDGHAQPNGGTSAASPLWAALIALMNGNLAAGQRVGFLTPLLYQAASGTGQTIGSVGCTDVVSGNNNTASVGGYSAGPGYDAASGWGTPHGQNLLAAIQAKLAAAPLPSGPSPAPATA
ncbi:serine protease, kumamolysin [Caballeronia catudaia]|uniref:Serine protease, kumamolysin n=1 Tax=Caballeronia catudaia TaxID=1777136 RepID=A0A158DGG0_9BURK|nr:S53 family peptidase [Caballeronia catudaia]SAK93490.1 serine protease, kumamolysin [Caballeronia catudaia]